MVNKVTFADFRGAIAPIARHPVSAPDHWWLHDAWWPLIFSGKDIKLLHCVTTCPNISWNTYRRFHKKIHRYNSWVLLAKVQQLHGKHFYKMWQSENLNSL